MQNLSFLCEFVCTTSIDYQCTNRNKHPLHTKHNDFYMKFTHSVRMHTRKELPSPIYLPPCTLKNKNVCKKYVFMQNLLFLCEFLCSILLDYQYINLCK